MQIAIPMKNVAYSQRNRRSVESFRHDGMELARRRPHRRTLPIRQLLQFALAVMAFKVFLFLQIGAVAYTAKMTELAQGNQVERIAAKVMILDPLSQWVVDIVRF